MPVIKSKIREGTLTEATKAKIDIYDPSSLKDFINPKTNRPVTPFQLKVYQLCSQIPEGKISTYGAMAKFLKSSPRAVGQALRLNPFYPLPVPCHRVITANFSIGGYNGEWNQGKKIDTKMELLSREGCEVPRDLPINNDNDTNKPDITLASKNHIIDKLKSKLFSDFK